jgi:hypothetical protein
MPSVTARKVTAAAVERDADGPPVRAGQADGDLVLHRQVPVELGVQAEGVEGLKASQTIGAQVKGSGTVYCVMAHAKNVTLTVDLLQNGTLVAHRTKTVTLVPPTLTVPVTFTCTVGDTYQTTATWDGKTVHTPVTTATTC